MTEHTAYDIHTDIGFDMLQHIDVQKLVDNCEEDWFNQTLCKVNDCVVRLGIVPQVGGSGDPLELNHCASSGSRFGTVARTRGPDRGLLPWGFPWERIGAYRSASKNRGRCFTGATFALGSEA